MNMNAVKFEIDTEHKEIKMENEIKMEEEEIIFADEEMKPNAIKLGKDVMENDIMFKSEIKIEEEESTFEDQNDNASSLTQTNIQDLYIEEGHKADSYTFKGEVSSETGRQELIEKRSIEQHDSDKFSCLNCNFLFESEDKLVSHLELSCKGSSSQYSSENNCESDLETCLLNHKNEEKSNVKTRLFKCSECSYECNQKRYLKQHILKHQNTKLIKCSECSKCIIENILKTKFSSKSFAEKREILKEDRPTPCLLIKSKAKQCIRKFNATQYNKTKWLTGCTNLQKLFCWPCLLFNNEIMIWNFTGFDDLNNLHKAIKRHESSPNHVTSSVELARFGKSSRVEFLRNKQNKLSIQMHNEKVKKNKDIMRRLIDVTCYLGEQELTFRTHDESQETSNKGNNVELINLIKKYDPLLESHLEQCTVFSGMSNQIQNDLISCIGEVIINKIKSEINESQFVAIILEETTDIRTLSLLSKTVRYINSDGEVCERFLGFENVSDDRTAVGISKIVFKIVDEYKIGSKLVAQTYDGASVMSGELNGLQRKVREKYPNALFIHCMAHRLNLVLSQSVKNIKECDIFFTKLKTFSLFFTKSRNRVNLLDKELKKRFPNVATTRWNYNGSLVETVKEYKEGLVELLQSIEENISCWDTETFTCAQALLRNLEDFEFNLLLNIFADIFSNTNVIFDILRNKIFDISYCISKVMEMQNVIKLKREKFDQFWSAVDGLYPPRKRSRNDSSNDIKAAYRRLFFEILDVLYTEIDDRFKNLKDLEFLGLLDPRNHEGIKKKFPDLVLKSLQENYRDMFDIDRLKSELLFLYNDGELKGKSVYNLFHYLKTNELDNVLQQLAKLSRLVLTLPATSASAERSFSRLKRIHNYARNTQGDGKLANLAVIGIERKLLKDMKSDSFYEDVINLFNSVGRRIELTYK